MQPPEYAAILSKTGKALVAVGVIDIVVMIYCIVAGYSYSSSLNIFAVVAGVFLLRGSLRAAAIVRWLSVFFLAASCTVVIAWPFIQPLDLTLTQIRLHPAATAGTILFLAFVLALLLWVKNQLGQPLILAAQSAAGTKVHSVRITASVGIAMVVVLAAIMPILLGSQSGLKAKSLAAQQLGASYQYHVSSLSISTSGQGTSVRATVTAWNEQEVRSVPLEWSE